MTEMISLNVIGLFTQHNVDANDYGNRVFRKVIAAHGNQKRPAIYTMGHPKGFQYAVIIEPHRKLITLATTEEARIAKSKIK